MLVYVGQMWRKTILFQTLVYNGQTYGSFSKKGNARIVRFPRRRSGSLTHRRVEVARVDEPTMISHANPLHELAGWTTRTKNDDEIVAVERDRRGGGHQRDPHLHPRGRGLDHETTRRDGTLAHPLRSATPSLLQTLLPNLENRSSTSRRGLDNPLESTTTARVETSLAELMNRVEVLERKLDDTTMSVPTINSPCRLVRASPSSRLLDAFVELHLEATT